MSEYEILSLYVAATADQTSTISLLISLHLALIVGVFYFLHRSGLVMKLAVFALYTLAFALLLGMLYNQGSLLLGASRDLVAITASGQRLSAMGYAALSQTRAEYWVNIVTSVSLCALWGGAVYFLIFWKKKEA